MSENELIAVLVGLTAAAVLCIAVLAIRWYFWAEFRCMREAAEERRERAGVEPTRPWNDWRDPTDFGEGVE